MSPDEAEPDNTQTTQTISTTQTPTGISKSVCNDTLRLLEEMKTLIWQRRPILGEIMKKHGDQTLYDYAKDFIDVNKAPRLDCRKEELITVVKELVTARLGAHIGNAVAMQLRNVPLVSTADHHGPITHPFFVNSNIISALPYFEQIEPSQLYLINFSFSSISVNNTSFPRGLMFHGEDNGTGLIRLPILSDKFKMSVVYEAPSYSAKDIVKTSEQLFLKKKSGEVAPHRAERIQEVLDRFFSTPSVLASADFATQVTKINYNLWPFIFHNQFGSAPVFSLPTKRIPDLIYVEIETIVTELLIRHHISNPESLLYRLCFESDYQKCVAQFFNNIHGGFSRENGWGTYLFWAVDQKLHRVRLMLKNGKLCSESGEHMFAFTPESISDALTRKRIFPSMLLCYLVVSLYYGMKCLGGFSQVNDLTMLKKAWREFLSSIKEDVEAESILPVQTKELGGDGMVLAYIGERERGLVPATGIDMLINFTTGRYARFVELSKKMTLNEAMSPLLIDIYNVLYSSLERSVEFNSLSSQSILNATGLDRKLSQY